MHEISKNRIPHEISKTAKNRISRIKTQKPHKTAQVAEKYENRIPHATAIFELYAVFKTAWNRTDPEKRRAVRRGSPDDHPLGKIEKPL